VPFAMQGSPLLGAGAGDCGLGDCGLVFSEVAFETPRQRTMTAFKRAVMGARYKLIRDVSTGDIELFDLELDPAETRSLAHERSEIVADLLRELTARQQAARARALEAPIHELGDAAIDRLKELGYLRDGPDAQSGVE
jgi:hypothetical protein